MLGMLPTRVWTMRVTRAGRATLLLALLVLWGAACSQSEPSPAATPSPTASSTPASVPTATSTRVPGATSTAAPTATPTRVPAATFTPAPTPTSTRVPAATSTPAPTAASGVGSDEIETLRKAYAAAVLGDGRSLLTGGADDPFKVLEAAEVYDTVTMSSYPFRSSARSPRFQAAVLLADARVLMANGVDERFAIRASDEIYNPTHRQTHSARRAVADEQDRFARNGVR